MQKENGELRNKIKTILQRRSEQTPEPDKIVAVDGKGEPWQDIVMFINHEISLSHNTFVHSSRI